MAKTRDYLINQYKIKHEQEVYGNTGVHHHHTVNSFIKEFNIKSVLDYGAGQSKLIDKLSPKIKDRYDPAIPGIDALPTRDYDLITCTDVMEHLLNEADAASVLGELVRKGRYVYLTISCQIAKKTLPDGTNCHTLVRSPDWWLERIEELGVDVIYKNKSENYLELFITSL